MKYAVQAAKRFVSAPAWKGFIGQPVGAFANATTDAALEAYIRQNSATYIPHSIRLSSVLGLLIS
jgi:hypothetical protein